MNKPQVWVTEGNSYKYVEEKDIFIAERSIYIRINGEMIGLVDVLPDEKLECRTDVSHIGIPIPGSKKCPKYGKFIHGDAYEGT